MKITYNEKIQMTMSIVKDDTERDPIFYQVISYLKDNNNLNMSFFDKDAINKSDLINCVIKATRIIVEN